VRCFAVVAQVYDGAAVAIRPVMLRSRPIRILVVDDDLNARTALGALLRDDEHEVELARDGIDALAKLATFHADVIVTDVRMPRMDGLSLYDAVARLPMPTPRFVFMSANAQPDLGSGSRFVVKPIAIERLTSLIAEAADAA
jgi:CheY-like chemotaxis protein